MNQYTSTMDLHSKLYTLLLLKKLLFLPDQISINTFYVF